MEGAKQGVDDRGVHRPGFPAHPLEFDQERFRGLHHLAALGHEVAAEFAVVVADLAVGHRASSSGGSPRRRRGSAARRLELRQAKPRAARARWGAPAIPEPVGVGFAAPGAAGAG